MEMWAFRRMQRISWVRRMSNEAVLNQTGQDRNLLKRIRKRQLGFLGHCLRKGKLEHVAVCGKINGKRAPGRQRTTFLKQFQTSTEQTLLKKNTESKRLKNQHKDRQFLDQERHLEKKKKVELAIWTCGELNNDTAQGCHSGLQKMVRFSHW